jgi:hypothetical protein
MIAPSDGGLASVALSAGVASINHATHQDDTSPMTTKIIVMLTSTVGSSAGWWVGSQFGGIMTCFMLSMVGMGAGIWGGRILAIRLEL